MEYWLVHNSLCNNFPINYLMNKKWEITFSLQIKYNHCILQMNLHSFKFYTTFILPYWTKRLTNLCSVLNINCDYHTGQACSVTFYHIFNQYITDSLLILFTNSLSMLIFSPYSSYTRRQEGSRNNGQWKTKFFYEVIFLY